MCGIVSLWSPKAIQKHNIQKAMDALTHRGPDGEGLWLSDNQKIALGHRRLSIIDLHTGAQPLSTTDGSVHMVVNGEFYDFENIRTDLQSKGHKFKTSSDSEIALHLYREYGLDFLEHLRGEFALILYDQSQNRLIAARDRFGIKPLCFAQDDNKTLYLASEAKAIFAAGYRAEWDQYAFFHACNVQYTPADRTLFKGVKQLQPGHVLIYDGQNLNIKKYWDLDYPQEPITNNKNETDSIEEFKAVFENSIKLRLRADVPICFHLSGGLDSSAVAALSMHIQDKPMDCFTVSFEHEGYDELPYAQEMAAKMDAPLHVVSVSQDDLVHAIPDAVYYSEGLAINGHLAGKFMLSKAIRDARFKVALTGEGADEVLAGYPHLREDIIQYGEANDQTTEQLKTLYESNDKLAGVFLAHGETLNTETAKQALGFLPSFLKAKASLGLRVTSMLSDEFAMDNDIYSDLVGAFDIPRQLKGRHIVNQSSYLWTKLTLANYILRTLGDGCEMAHSIEGRLPFLDHHLFEMVKSLPMSMKINGLIEKYILREAAKPYLTETVYKRQKHPFIAPPVSRFSNSALNGFIQDMLRSQDFATMPFWNQGKVLNWLDNLPHQTEKDQAAAEPVLMMILTSFVIHQKFALS